LDTSIQEEGGRMTKEEFNLLNVGDVIYLTEGSRYEIVERRASGFCNFDIMLSCKSLIDNSDIYFLYSHAQFYMTSNIDLKNWIIFKISELNIFWSNNQEQNSIEYFLKKIEDTKYELNRLENTLKGLQESKRMKELTETLSNLILGDFYTVNVANNIFTGKFKGNANNVCGGLVFDTLTIDKIITKRHIKQIIHRPNFSNEYRILLKKIDTFNSDLENA
jgi:hypothetical protein